MSSLILPLSAERSLKQHRNLEKRRQIDEFVKVAKSFMSSAGFGQGSPVAGNARGYGAGGVTPGTPMRTSWTNNAGNAAILQRATQAYGQQHNLPVGELEQALADQGLSWGPPFAPGRPLDPFTGYRQPARTRNYPVGENVQITPRRGRVSFEILRAIHEAWDVSGICVQHLVNDVRSLDSSWLPADGVKTDVSADVEKAQAFFLKPDRRRPFRNWLAMWLQDVFRWDAGALYVRRNNLGEPIALEVVDGSTVIPLADYYGRLPLDETDNDEPFDTLDLDAVDIVPAYVQIIQGMPWTWLTAEDLIYLPLNPVPESQYGLAPIEKVMMSGNLDVRFQMHFLQYFTSGSLPAGLMEAPADMSDPAQIQQWQEIWDAIMLGDQEKLRQIRWVPAGAKFTATKNSDFDEKFPLYLMRRGCAAYGVTPADLGFTECYSEDTECLTDSGWKRCGELVDDDLVAGYDPQTRTIDYVKPTHKYVASYRGDMIHFKSRSVDVLVTPGHRMWGWRQTQDRDPSRRPWREHRADVLEHASEFGFVGSVTYDAPEIATFLLPGVEARRNGRRGADGRYAPPELVAPDAAGLAERKFCALNLHLAGLTYEQVAHDLGYANADSAKQAAYRGRHSTGLADRLVAMDDWLAFLGYFVSEGSLSGRKQGHYNVSLTQSLTRNPDKAREMGELLERLPVSWSVIDTDDGCRNWGVGDKSLFLWLEANVGTGSRGKRLPPVFRQLGLRQTRILLDALILGDGARDLRHGRDTSEYGTMSAQLADDVQELAMRLGYRANSACNRIGFWRVKITEGHDHQLRSKHVTRVPYDGTVWCVEVPSHLFVTRRNGKVAVQGNTVNRSSGDTQIDVQFRVGTRPPSRHVEDVLTLFAQHELGLRVKFQIDDGREVEDRVATAQAHSIYIQAGVESPDEVRDEIGRPTDKTQAVSRFIQTRQGVVMLEELLGKTQNPIDPETFAPAGKVAYVPPVPAPIAPAAAGASEQAAASDATPAGEKPAVPGGQDAANTNTSPVTKAETAGITAATRIAGVDLLGHSTDDDDEDDDDDSEIRKALVDVALRRWRSNARNRLRKGQAPRRFVDSNLPDGLRDAVWRRLEHATTREQVDQAFSNPKALARKAGASTPGDFWRHAARIVEHYSPLVAEALHGLWSDETLEAAATAAAEPEGKAAALTVLEGGKGSTDALRRLLAELYGDAGLQGAHEAAHAAGGQVVASLQGVTTQLPDSYWDAWQPGWGDAAAKVAGGGLKQLLDAADITIKGMTDSAIERVGNALAEALAAGDSYQDAAKAVREIVASKARSELIANTETCRAMTQAALDTYHENGIEQVSWQAEATACPACEANAGGGPYALDDAPTVPPEHPGCRCNLLPIVDE